MPDHFASRRRLFSAGAAGALAVTAAGELPANAASARPRAKPRVLRPFVRAEPASVGDALDVTSITIEPEMNYGFGYSQFGAESTAVIVGPGLIDDGNPGFSLVGTGPALHVTGLGPSPALVLSIEEGTTEAGKRLDGDGLVVEVGGAGTAVVASTKAGDTVSLTSSRGRALLAESAGAPSTITATNTGSGPVFYAHAETAGAAASISNAGAGPGLSVGGTRAAINLRPGSRPSHPPAGAPGDLYVDRNHRLWFFGHGWVQLA